MVDFKLIDFKEVVSIAKEYVDQTDEPLTLRSILEMMGDDYDYIFEVLQHDIMVGDFKAPEKLRDADRYAVILRDDNYRVVKFNHRGENLLVVKVIRVAGQEFHMGLLVCRSGKDGIIHIGCFNRHRSLAGYGI